MHVVTWIMAVRWERRLERELGLLLNMGKLKRAEGSLG